MKSAGIDLLDRLFRNQILVHLVFGEEERDWLRFIATQVRVAVEELDATGLQAERLIHGALCLLEVNLADELMDLGKHIPVGPVPLPEGVTDTTVLAVSQLHRDFFGALSLVANNFGGSPEEKDVAFEIASRLVGKFSEAPPAVRYRLVERVLAIEFPNAPIHVFAWLAEMGIVPSAKFGNGKERKQPSGTVVARSASICEFEMLRSYVAGAMRLGRRDGGWPEQLLSQLGAKLSEKAKDRLLSVMQAEERRQMAPGLKNSLTVLIASRWKEKDYIESFFTKCHSMAPYARAALHKQSTALTDIAAAMIAIETGSSDKALYVVDGPNGSIAHDVSAELRKLGFEVHPRTIYRRYGESLPRNVANLSGYFKLLKMANTALPAEFGDLYHYYQVGFTS